MRFDACGSLSHTMADDFQFKLYSRTANQSGPVWAQLLNDSIVPYPGLNTTIKGFDLSSVNALGQFLIMRDTVTPGIADVIMSTPDQPNPIVEGGESISLLMHSDHQALQLPQVSIAMLASFGTPVQGQMVFLTDSASVAYYNGIRWMVLNLEPRLQYTPESAPTNNGTVSVPGVAANTSTLVKLDGGMINLPVFTSAALLDVGFLTPGMLVYETTSRTIKCYNGNEWHALSATATSLPTSNATPPVVPGIAINQNYKHPSSVLDINPSGGKAFQLPKVDPDQIYNPVIGLICFNPLNNRLMLFDGLKWNVIK